MRSCALCSSSSDGPAPLSSSPEHTGAALAAAPHIPAALDCCRSMSFSLPPKSNRSFPGLAIGNWQQLLQHTELPVIHIFGSVTQYCFAAPVCHEGLQTIYFGEQHRWSVHLCRRSSSLRMSSASPRTS